MICNNCGNQIEDGVGFCRFCGASTVTQSQPTMERAATGEYTAATPDIGGTSYQKMPKKKKNLKWLIPVIAVVVVIGVLAAIFIPKLVKGSKHKSPKKVVEAFIEGLEKGDMDKVVDCYHPSQRKAIDGDESEMQAGMMLMQMFSFSIGDVEYYSDEDVAEINEEYGTDFEAVCEVEMKLSYMGESQGNPTYTVKDDGKWYLYNFDLAEDEDDYYEDDDFDFDFDF